MTSNQALSEVKKLYNCTKAGHGGTLDPMATGLLLIFLGDATRFSGYSLDQHKTYESTFRLGVETSTFDKEGDVVKADEVSIAFDKIKEAAATMENFTSQVPPMYSAIKIDGVPMYKRARNNEKVDLPPRPIKIHSVELLSDESDLPDVCFRIKCSKGTYIRSLAMDFGKLLGTVGTVWSLRRTAIGDISVDYSFGLTELNKMSKDQRQLILQPADIHIKYLPEIEISRDETLAFMNGSALKLKFKAEFDLLRLIDLEAGFVGIAELTQQGTGLKSKRMFPVTYVK